ncbi:MAG: hypothetical protein RIS35_2462 [Pseudomonadota bacterium]
MRIIRLFGVAFAIIVALVVLLAVFNPEPSEPPAPLAPDHAAMCKAAVPMKYQFKDPSSIRFDSVAKVNTTDGGILYAMTIGAKNSFGGYVLMHCSCDILRDQSVHITCSQR